MKQITLAEFILGYEKDYILNVVTVKNRIYGKDERIASLPKSHEDREKTYEIVWADISGAP